MKKIILSVVAVLAALSVSAHNDCAWAEVRWADDPLVDYLSAEAEKIIPILRPEMIMKNEAGECLINNGENGFISGTAELDWEGYAKVLFIDRAEKKTFYDLEKAEELALAICNSVSV